MTNFAYQFSGYQLPKIQLDETGPSYVFLKPHPYFYNQPKYWEKAIMYIGQREKPEQIAIKKETHNKNLYGFLKF